MHAKTSDLPHLAAENFVVGEIFSSLCLTLPPSLGTSIAIDKIIVKFGKEHQF